MSGEPTRHTRRKGVVKLCGAGFLLLSAAAIGGAWWMWGWRLRPLRFHESWSEEQRTQLQQAHDDIRHIGDELARQKKMMEDEYEGENLFRTIRDYITISYHNRRDMVELDDVLHHVAATGQADYTSPNGISAAYIACRTGQHEMVKEMIRRGSNPNQIYQEGDTPGESLLQAALLCMSLTGQQQTSIEQRLELVVWLLAHGADKESNRFPTSIFIYPALEEALKRNGNGWILTERLLEHGFTLQSEHDLNAVCLLFTFSKDALPHLQKLIGKGWFDTSSELTQAKLLRGALEVSDYLPIEDNVDKLIWCLDELKIDPNLALQPYEEVNEGSHFYHPITALLSKMVGDYAMHLKSQEMLEKRLHLLHILLEHGSRPESAVRKLLQLLPPAPRAACEEVFEQYHIAIPEA